MISVDGPKKMFGRRGPRQEFAAWQLWHESDSDGSRSLLMLSDGRLLPTGGVSYSGPSLVTAHTPREMLTAYSEEGALYHLEHARDGLQRMV